MVGIFDEIDPQKTSNNPIMRLSLPGSGEPKAPASSIAVAARVIKTKSPSVAGATATDPAIGVVAVDELAGHRDEGELNADLEPRRRDGAMKVDVINCCRGWSEASPVEEGGEEAEDHAPVEQHPDRDRRGREVVGHGVVVDLVAVDRAPVVECSEHGAEREEGELTDQPPRP